MLKIIETIKTGVVIFAMSVTGYFLFYDEVRWYLSDVPGKDLEEIKSLFTEEVA
jgi:hypothetical protein